MSVRDALKRLSTDSLVYGLGQVGGKAVNLLLVPLLTRLLVVGEFGASDTVITYCANSVLVLVFGMDSALARFFYEQPDRETRLRMTSSSFMWRVASGGAVALLLFVFAGPLAGWLLGGAAYAKYVRLGALTIPCTLLVLYANDVLRVTFQPWKFITLNVTWALLVGGLTFEFAWVLHRGVAGVLYGKLGGDALTALVGLVLCRHHLRPRFSRTLLRRMLAFGAPLVPVSIAYAVIASADRLAIAHVSHSLDALGPYGVAMKFFAVITMFVSAFNLAFGPLAYARAQDPDAPKLYARVFALYVAFASMGALVVGVFAPAIVGLLAGSRYAAAAAPALWLSFAAVAQGAFAIAVLGITLALRTRLLIWIALATAAVAIAANAVLPRLLAPAGVAEGAAMATFAAHTTATVLAYLVAQRVRPLPYRGARVALLFGSALALGWAAVHFAPAGLAGVGVKLGAALAFVALAVTLRVWTDQGAVRHRPSAGGIGTA